MLDREYIVLLCIVAMYPVALGGIFYAYIVSEKKLRTAFEEFKTRDHFSQCIWLIKRKLGALFLRYLSR